MSHHARQGKISTLFAPVQRSLTLHAREDSRKKVPLSVLDDSVVYRYLPADSQQQGRSFTGLDSPQTDKENSKPASVDGMQTPARQQETLGIKIDWEERLCRKCCPGSWSLSSWKPRAVALSERFTPRNSKDVSTAHSYPSAKGAGGLNDLATSDSHDGSSTYYMEDTTLPESPLLDQRHSGRYPESGGPVAPQDCVAAQTQNQAQSQAYHYQPQDPDQSQTPVSQKYEYFGRMQKMFDAPAASDRTRDAYATNSAFLSGGKGSRPRNQDAGPSLALGSFGAARPKSVKTPRVAPERSYDPLVAQALFGHDSSDDIEEIDVTLAPPKPRPSLAKMRPIEITPQPAHTTRRPASSGPSASSTRTKQPAAAKIPSKPATSGPAIVIVSDDDIEVLSIDDRSDSDDSGSDEDEQDGGIVNLNRLKAQGEDITCFANYLNQFEPSTAKKKRKATGDDGGRAKSKPPSYRKNKSWFYKRGRGRGRGRSG
ncbi:hypothetical protein HDV03_001260 [Kappamyces sp. JEL0829]|nr:hypothetical protein HDV03_001260 [Kappamyces sp. JEL0829]